MFKKIAIFLLFISAITSTLCALEQIDETQFDSFVRRIIEKYKIPGVSIAVFNANEILYTFGDGKTIGKTAIDSDTVFYLGSTSKTLTALAILKLYEQGKIDLDVPYNRYVPEFTSPYAEQLTIRHLLHHRSGLASRELLLGENSFKEELKSINQKCVSTIPPGERYIYFNGNYRLLGLLAEEVSGMEFEDYMRREILSPLELENIYAGLPSVKNSAQGHGRFFGIPFCRNQVYRPGALTSGYFSASTGDLGRLLINILQSYEGNGIFRHDTIAESWTVMDNEDESYAMGWLKIRDGDSFFLVHGGALENFQSFLYLNPDKQFGFVLLINQGGLLSTYGGFSSLRAGLINMLSGVATEEKVLNPIFYIVYGIFVLIFFLELFLFFRLLKKKESSLAGIIIESALSLFFLLGFIPLMNRIMGGGANWRFIGNILPELFVLLWIIIIFGLARALIKIGYLFHFPKVR